VGFHSAAFEVMTEDLLLTRSVQSTAVSKVAWGFVQNKEAIMKLMAVTYVNDMMREIQAIQHKTSEYVMS
jgi:hypothetical protein